MRSRLAITTMLATGLLMSGGGAALGVSALSSTDSASVAQYGTGTTTTTTTTVTTPTVTTQTTVPAPTLSGVAGSQEESPDDVAGVQGGGGRPTGAVAGVQVDEAPEAAAQAPRQLAADGELPFTGFASITMLVVGLLLLAGGVVLRRSTRRPDLQL